MPGATEIFITSTRALVNVMDMDQHPTYQSNFVHAQCGHGQQSKVSIQLYASTRSCWRQIQHLPRASKKIKPNHKGSGQERDFQTSRCTYYPSHNKWASPIHIPKTNWHDCSSKLEQ